MDILRRRYYLIVKNISPYSGAATVALIDAFGAERWPQIRDYGFAHQEIVPYVNANPLCISIWLGYAQEGLVVQLDCDYKCTTNKWENIRGPLSFTGTNVTLENGVPKFNGGYYSSTDTKNYPYSTHTIEVVFRPSSVTDYFIYNGGTPGGTVTMHYTQRNGVGYIGTAMYINTNFFRQNIQNGQLYSVSAKGTSAFANKNSLTLQKVEGYGTRNGKWIGARSSSESKFNGKIYAIRIYNRLLSNQEILDNQTIDLLRWQNR